MKLFLNFLLFTIVLFLNTRIYAQKEQKYSCLFSHKCSSYSGLNLQDSVKSVNMRLTNLKEILSKEEGANIILFNGVRHNSYIEFDKYGRLQAQIPSIPGENFFAQIDYSRADKYVYDDKDWDKKSKYKTVLKQHRPVYNHNLLLKLNQIEVPDENEVLEEEGKIWQDYVEYVYNYIYDKSDRIIEEKEYNVARLGKETLHKKYKKEDLFTRKLFTYNDKGQVVNQKIIAGLHGKDRSYIDMGTDCGFCEDLQLQYAYDPLGRINQVTMFGCGKIVAQEDYIYHPTQDYVATVKYYVTGPGEISNPTKRFIKTFNDYGDLIKEEFLLDDPEQELPVKEYYYSYEYDSHNNWIKCNIYMEGTQEGIPSLVAERKIEYYN